MPDLVERTAIAPFELRGQDVRVGQVVTLDRSQVKRLSAAGCVHETDEDNATATKADLPPVQREDVEREAADAASKLESIRQSVIDARSEADADIRAASDAVKAAAEEADKAVAEHRERAAKAAADADEAVKGHEARVAKAKAEADEAEKASKTKAAEKAKG